jgi:hypothetical protein
VIGIDACCPRAANGHAAAPPMSVMNSRRLMGVPLLRLEATHYHTAIAKTLLLHHSKIDRRMAEMGQTRQIDKVPVVAACPLRRIAHQSTGLHVFALREHGTVAFQLLS